MSESIDEYWLSRFRAVGRAQARHLWLLLISCLFFAALATSPPASTDEKAISVPVIDLRLDRSLLLASAPAVISFLLLMVMGSFRALRVAAGRLGPDLSGPGAIERFDDAPNAIDFALYTDPDSSSLVQAVLFLAYPLLLLVPLAEVVWLWCSLQQTAPAPTGWIALRIAAIILASPASVLVILMIVGRVKLLKGDRHRKGPGPTSSSRAV